MQLYILKQHRKNKILLRKQKKFLGGGTLILYYNFVFLKNYLKNLYFLNCENVKRIKEKNTNL